MAFGETAEVAMDYDWLWLILAVGVLAPVGSSARLHRVDAETARTAGITAASAAKLCVA